MWSWSYLCIITYECYIEKQSEHAIHQSLLIKTRAHMSIQFSLRRIFLYLCTFVAALKSFVRFFFFLFFLSQAVEQLLFYILCGSRNLGNAVYYPDICLFPSLYIYIYILRFPFSLTIKLSVQRQRNTGPSMKSNRAISRATLEYSVKSQLF